MPCVDDCITFLLGSCEKRKEISNEMGTYFLTKGWLDYENNIWEEYQYTVKRMGKEKADRVYKIMLQHYKRLGVIDTGAYNLEDFLKESKLVAKDLKALWPLVYYLFIWWPKPIRDAIYSWIAKNRYKWFGKQDQCMIPEKSVSHRFLE